MLLIFVEIMSRGRHCIRRVVKEKKFSKASVHSYKVSQNSHVQLQKCKPSDLYWNHTAWHRMAFVRWRGCWKCVSRKTYTFDCLRDYKMRTEFVTQSYVLKVMQCPRVDQNSYSRNLNENVFDVNLFTWGLKRLEFHIDKSEDIGAWPCVNSTLRCFRAFDQPWSFWFPLCPF